MIIKRITWRVNESRMNLTNYSSQPDTYNKQNYIWYANNESIVFVLFMIPTTSIKAIKKIVRSR